MQLTKNFHDYEFACKDGRPVPVRFQKNMYELAKNLQALRDHFGEAVHVNSSYRPDDYNARVGGAKDSQHLTASAADITVKSKTPAQVKAAILKLIKEGKMAQGGIGLYKGFVHYDIRGMAARW